MIRVSRQSRASSSLSSKKDAKDDDDAMIPLLSKAIREYGKDNFALKHHYHFSPDQILLPSLTSTTSTSSEEDESTDDHQGGLIGYGLLDDDSLDDNASSAVMSMTSMSDCLTNASTSSMVLPPPAYTKQPITTASFTLRSVSSFDEESGIYTSSVQQSSRCKSVAGYDTSFERSTIYSNDDTWLSASNNHTEMRRKRLGGHPANGDDPTAALPIHTTEWRGAGGKRKSQVVVLGIPQHQPCNRKADNSIVDDGMNIEAEIVGLPNAQRPARHTFWQRMFGCLDNEAVVVGHHHEGGNHQSTKEVKINKDTVPEIHDFDPVAEHVGVGHCRRMQEHEACWI